MNSPCRSVKETFYSIWGWPTGNFGVGYRYSAKLASHEADGSSRSSLPSNLILAAGQVANR